MIFQAIFFAIRVAAILTNSSSISKGFCDKDLVNLTLTTECDFSDIKASIHNDQTNFDTFLLQCNNKICFTQWTYVLKNQTLDVSFPFYHGDHGGKFINFMTTCQNQTFSDHAFLKPCLSGFTGNATVVGSNVTLYCEHPLYNESTSGIRITNKENDIAQCFNQTCVAGTGLPNGVSVEVEYRTGMIFLCKMDGAIFNLTENIIVLTSSSPTKSTSPVTGDEDNSAKHVAIDSLMTFFILIIHLFPYITS